MSTASQYESVDDGEPPSSDLGRITAQFLRVLDGHNFYSGFSVGEGGTRIALQQHDIRVAMGGLASRRYESLGSDARQDLEQLVYDQLVHTAHWTAGGEYTDARVMMGNLPLFFEPTRHAMMMGQRQSDELPMTLESTAVDRREQQRILMGGVAAFVWFLEK